MGCKADFAANSTAIYKKFNARHVTFAARVRAITDRVELCRGPLADSVDFICYYLYSKLFNQDVGKCHIFLS